MTYNDNDGLMEIIFKQIREIRTELQECSEADERHWLVEEQYKLALILSTLHDENRGKKNEVVDFND